MRHFSLITTVISGSILASCGGQSPLVSKPSIARNQSDFTETKEAWDARNDPARFGAVSLHYLDIPSSAGLNLLDSPWSAGYWPTYRGGIANRWQSGVGSSNYQDHLYNPLSVEAANRLSEEEIDVLSPAEKLDLLLGRTDFPLVRQQHDKMLRSVRNGQVPSWYGLCHGWAAAAIAEPLPTQVVTLRDESGRVIRFSPLDIAGLASALYSELLFPIRISGARCNTAEPSRDERGRVSLANGRDVNPATFHLHLAQFLAAEGKSFIADFYYADQVWNFPIESYEFTYSNRRELTAEDPFADVRAPGTAYLVDVTLNVSHVALLASHLPPRQGANDIVTMTYTLELNAEEFVIGGEWTSDNYPDFLWTVDAVAERSRNAFLDVDTIRSLLQASAL